MSHRMNSYLHHRTHGLVAVLICTAVGDLAAALVAAGNPDSAPVALGTIVTLTAAGVAAAGSLMRPSTP